MYESIIDAELLSYTGLGASNECMVAQISSPAPKKRTHVRTSKTVYIIYVGDAQLCTVIEVYSDAIKDYHLHSYLLVN